MVEVIYIHENKPFPNHSLPVLYYPEALLKLANSLNAAEKVITYFEKNGYSNGWVNGIFSYHHFHSNTSEVLACITGEAHVQLGGPGADVFLFKKGDVLLLPAGVAHKRIDATHDFRIVGAYPNGMSPDMKTGKDTNHYEAIKRSISGSPIPQLDPVEGKEEPLSYYWKQ